MFINDIQYLIDWSLSGDLSFLWTCKGINKGTLNKFKLNFFLNFPCLSCEICQDEFYKMHDSTHFLRNDKKSIECRKKTKNDGIL